MLFVCPVWTAIGRTIRLRDLQSCRALYLSGSPDVLLHQNVSSTSLELLSP